MKDTQMIHTARVAGFILTRKFLSEIYMIQKSVRSLYYKQGCYNRRLGADSSDAGEDLAY
jgi:hypothetical protein